MFLHYFDQVDIGLDSSLGLFHNILYSPYGKIGEVFSGSKDSLRVERGKSNLFQLFRVVSLDGQCDLVQDLLGLLGRRPVSVDDYVRMNVLVEKSLCAG